MIIYGTDMINLPDTRRQNSQRSYWHYWLSSGTSVVAY